MGHIPTLINFGDIMENVELFNSRDYYKEDDYGHMDFDYDLFEEDLKMIFGTVEGEFAVHGRVQYGFSKDCRVFDHEFDNLGEAIMGTFPNCQFEFEVYLDPTNKPIGLVDYYNYLQGAFHPCELLISQAHHDGWNLFRIVELTEEGHEMYTSLYTEMYEVLEVGLYKNINWFGDIE